MASMRGPGSYARLAAMTVALASCSPPPSAPITPPPLEPLRVDVDGASFVMRHGIARPRGSYLELILSDRPLACELAWGEHTDLDALGYPVVLIELPPGPGNGFYDGRPVGTTLWFHSSHAAAEAAPHTAVIRLTEREPGEQAKVAGELHAHTRFAESRGRTHRDTRSFAVSGRFEVPLCAPGLAGLEPSSPFDDAPAHAELVGSEHFELGSAIAVVSHDADNRDDFLTSLIFFGDAGVDCATFWELLARKDSLTVTSFGASRRWTPVGAAAPATATFHFQRPGNQRPPFPAISREVDVLGAHGSVTLEAVAFEPGGRVRGHLSLGRSDVLLAGGRFDAQVCLRSP
jgi:hypothetical protein